MVEVFQENIGGIFVDGGFDGSICNTNICVNNVASARTTINGAATTLIASGIAVLTPGVILGLIGTVPSALILWNNGNSGNEAMKNAYNILEGVDGIPAVN
ncbi:hypothetical protein QJQ58_17170 [Paenibacillus dendritiformis]|uniref:hypothetical protein n=1 Tax=Paenibacillus dendritiformis TaxID=130049 RepID=UPI001059D870|nr:hypothetical protein [Paenibacillus dendritiformis]TDL48871.1 hypothetical protein E2R60_26145 [Paenibacillus dendritiformis]WGU92312.1 hypothetical protein QJQ58_17170 [Paenibacillus dendritiformis]